MTSDQPNEAAKQLTLWEEFVEQSQDIQRDDSTRAGIEKLALDDDANTLMHEIVDNVLMEMAWARVKANRGAPGPDGITVKDFPEWITSCWSDVRQQLLDGTYQLQAVRRVSIDKTGGGTRELGIPNLLDRVSKLPSCLSSRRSVIQSSLNRVSVIDHIARLTMQSGRCRRSSEMAAAGASTWIYRNSSIESSTTS